MTYSTSRPPAGSFVVPIALLVALGPMGAMAQSSGEIADLQRQVEDLQNQIDEVRENDSPVVFTNRDNVRLTFNGRISAVALYADQGPNDQFFFADNDASGSRFGFTAEADFQDLTAGLRFEIATEVNSTDDIDFGFTPGVADDDSDFGDVRQAHLFFESDRFGYLSIGQGNTAAEDTAHADLSGTSLGGAGSDVDDIAGGISFTPDDGTDLGSAGDIDAFFDIQDGFRETRVLYITPDIQGLSLGVSASTNDGDDGVEPAVGIYYDAEFGAIEMESAASWRIEEDGSDEDNIFVGSASFLHSSGINLTLAGSVGDIEGEDEDTTAFFVKLGYRADLFDFGDTRFSVDYFIGENNFEFASPSGNLPEAESIGVVAVQQISRVNAEIFAGYRYYDVSDVFIGGVETELDEMNVFYTGARIRF
ncbi:MAG: porin [Pseudomonadota bacterium]